MFLGLMLAVPPQGSFSSHYLWSTHYTDSTDTSLGPTPGKDKTLSGPCTLALAGDDAGQVFGEMSPSSNALLTLSNCPESQCSARKEGPFRPSLSIMDTSETLGVLGWPGYFLSLMHPFIWKCIIGKLMHCMSCSGTFPLSSLRLGRISHICFWRLLGTDFPPESQAICVFMLL